MPTDQEERLVSIETELAKEAAEGARLTALMIRPDYETPSDEFRERWEKEDEHGNKSFEVIEAANNVRRTELEESGAKLVQKIGHNTAWLIANKPDIGAQFVAYQEAKAHRPALKECQRKIISLNIEKAELSR